MSRLFYCITFLVLFLLVHGNVFATELLFSKVADAPRSVKDSGNLGNAWVVKLMPGIEQRLQEATILSLDLPGNISLKTEPGETREGNGLAGTTDIELTRFASLSSGPGGVELYMKAGRIRGMLVLDFATNRVFTAQFDENGVGNLQEQNANHYYCVDYPVVYDTSSGLGLRVQELLTSGNIPDYNELQELQSRPGAPNVIYVDYNGGVIAGSQWNKTHNNDQPIYYTAYDSDGNSGSFTPDEIKEMWFGWAEAAEDYAPFDVNVTTDRSVYDATPVQKRMHMVVTTSKQWYTRTEKDAGGVAWLGAFGSDVSKGDYERVAWVWNTGDSAMGQTISHESGHTMGLNHDGDPSEEYYPGHGNWGPVMGGPFGKSYVQWSKGEYPGANNQQDDLTEIKGMLGVITDDAGNDSASAIPLTLPVEKHEGLISPDGLTPDTDIYSFSLLQDTSLIMSIGPSLAVEGQKLGVNLSMKAELKDTSGRTLVAIHPNENPESNILAELHPLKAGSYTLRIDAQSYNNSWKGGFGEYGNGGHYQLTLKPHHGPDLALTAFDINEPHGDPIVLSPSETFEVVSHVSNVGDANSPASAVEYFLRDHFFSPPKDDTLGTGPVGVLAPGKTLDVKTSLTMPFKLGDRELFACVDTIPGGYEGNNCSAKLRVVLANQSVCDSGTGETVKRNEIYKSIDSLKSRGQLTLENVTVEHDNQYNVDARLYIEAPKVSLGANGTIFAVREKQQLSVRSIAPEDCH